MDLKKKMQSWHYQKRLLQKRENSKIRETINQRSRIESILPSTPNKNRGKK